MVSSRTTTVTTSDAVRETEDSEVMLNDYLPAESPLTPSEKATANHDPNPEHGRNTRLRRSGKSGETQDDCR